MSWGFPSLQVLVGENDISSALNMFGVLLSGEKVLESS